MGTFICSHTVFGDILGWSCHTLYYIFPQSQEDMFYDISFRADC